MKKRTTVFKKTAKRVLRFFLSPLVPLLRLHGKKRTVLLMDRVSAAGDNAEAMYHYLKTKRDVHAYYILKRNSADWDRLQPDGHIVRFGSLRCMILFIRADAVLFSFRCFRPRGFSLFAGKARAKQIFLQHGIMQGDLSHVYNAQRGHDLVIVATEDEYRDRLRKEYGYRREQVALTGMPRYDNLVKKEPKFITVALTWRKYLKKKTAGEFRGSALYAMLRELIIDPALADLAEKYGYRILFVPHPELGKYYLELLENEKDPRIETNLQRTYAEIFAQTALLITDYSSVAFDIAYLGTPVIYYQKDRDEFFSGRHTCGKGYFDHERDGFGEVVTEKEALLPLAEAYFAKRCEVKEEYRARADETFAFSDRHNCERVWNAVNERLFNELD